MFCNKGVRVWEGRLATAIWVWVMGSKYAFRGQLLLFEATFQVWDRSLHVSGLFVCLFLVALVIGTMASGLAPWLALLLL